MILMVKADRIIYLLAALVLVSCAHVQKHWDIAKSIDTIMAYEDFLRKHPESEFAGQARTRLEELAAQRDWVSAQAINSIVAYQEFLSSHPESPFSEQARTRLEKLVVLRDWVKAQTIDSIEAYEEFLYNHPGNEFTAQARTRLGEHIVVRDWVNTQAIDSIAAYEWFLYTHPESAFSEQARRRLESMRAELADWERALKKNTIAAYEEFLKRHPDPPYSEKAKAKIVDLEVSEIFNRPHGELPPASRVGGGGERPYSVINVFNDTPYSVTLRYSGNESFKVIFSPREKASIEILRGAYRVTASANAARVRDFAGEENLDGSDYESVYYIAGPNETPKEYFKSDKEFEAWQSKKQVPADLK